MRAACLQTLFRLRRHVAFGGVFVGAILLVGAGAGCKRNQIGSNPPGEPPPALEEGPLTAPPQRLTNLDGWIGRPRQVLATWYEVPVDSLAKKRAGSEELTAAHNQLPIGTLVRVTHLANGKSVRVRITDRGIHDRHVKLDLCKEAAEELGMVGKGIAKVQMEVLDDAGGSPPDSASVAAQP